VSIVQESFELDTRKVVYGGQFWRLLTHAFCHSRFGVWHIVVNMLLLYWFGATLESMYGPRESLLFYLTAAVFAGLTFVGLDLYTGSTGPGIGASRAVMAVMMLYTVQFPREQICIGWLFPLEMRWVMLLYLIYDLHPVLLALSGDRYSLASPTRRIWAGWRSGSSTVSTSGGWNRSRTGCRGHGRQTPPAEFNSHRHVRRGQ
jgi:rhomboid family protein